MTGKFIVVEGIDGSGSTTQAKLLCEFLTSRGRTCYFTAEPSGGPIGKVIRDLLKQKENKSQLFFHILALTFAADRLCHYDLEILPKLKAGVDVISDRYVLSSLVYQGLDVPQGWVKEVNRYAPQPDLTILIDTPEEVAKDRRLSRGLAAEVFEESDLQIQIRERYLKLAFTALAMIVEGSGDVNAVFERVKEAVLSSVDI